ncbi:hypothetical protein MBEHAL_1687 [Halarchaeum acidiphilum MH1-52-1]|uniref:Uncharacterized protein n=1 Tax=Halarchaeum acidiphilum MH1-52-1 TaxID=1261545 RepID=U2YVY1_9EURY|nr:hypothetical protein [Halarchaeum acidiphilum]GAD52927.1 hypothetical protein MBEHAL_1687 [Halarchaeum acidiphilum MH1-52-1]
MPQHTPTRFPPRRDVAATVGVAALLLVAVAAFAYDRSGSLVAPALAYLSFSLAEFAVLLTEAGGPAPF